MHALNFQKAMEEHFKEKPDKLFGHVIVLRSQPVTREPTRDAEMRPEVWTGQKCLCFIACMLVLCVVCSAMHKLLALGLVEEKDETLTAVPIAQGIRILDKRWDGYFEADAR